MNSARRNSRRSESRARKETERPTALSLNVSSRRRPAIDLKLIDDVPTAACVEMAREIMKRPEIRTGSFFKLVAASKNDVNKSDAVIVITAAILESIGNTKAAFKMLSRSNTVAEFYETLNLNNEKVRDSFCVMLFAIAPEFVKMVESALSNALDKVKEMTDAPHAGRKLLIASGELAREGSISTAEHGKMMSDFAAMRLDHEDNASPSSIQISPADGVTFDDSISRVARETTMKTNEQLNTKGIMRHIKRNPGSVAESFYTAFPTATKPVAPSGQIGRSGIGFRPAASAFSDDMSESAFTSAMNQILTPAMKPSQRARVDSIEPFSRDRIQFVKSNQSALSESMFDKTPNAFEYQVAEFAVTREDIDKKKEESGGVFNSGSKVNTSPEDVDMSLLDLL